MNNGDHKDPQVAGSKERGSPRSLSETKRGETQELQNDITKVLSLQDSKHSWRHDERILSATDSHTKLAHKVANNHQEANNHTTSLMRPEFIEQALLDSTRGEKQIHESESNYWATKAGKRKLKQECSNMSKN